MKTLTLPISILLVTVCLSVNSVQADTTSTAKKKKALATDSEKEKAQEAIAAARMKEKIGTIKFHDSSSLYDASNAAYLPKSPDTLFDFGPKSANIKYDKRMIMAMELASERAHKHSTSRCWSYVKSALVSANLVSSRPTTEYAKEAGEELTRKYGFKKLAINDPFEAPIGSVLVYGGRGAGHVEFRTSKGFVSDFTTDRPSRRPLIGVYVKPS